MKQITIPIKGNYQKNEPPVKRLFDVEFRARLDKGYVLNVMKGTHLDIDAK